MPSEKIGEYEIEYAGVQIAESENWAAYAAVFGPSRNPMHRNSVFSYQRVAVEQVFETEEAAAAEALKVAAEMIKQ